MKHVITRDWQPVGGSVEVRLIGTGDQRVDPQGAPIDGPWPLPPEVQATQRFVHGALIETRAGADDRGSDVRDFAIVSDMAMICCPRPPCHEYCVPQTLGEAIDWALNHDCQAVTASTAGE